MPKPDFHVDVDEQSVIARLDVSAHSPRTRFYACIFFVALGAVGICLLLFLPGKQGNPSMWQALSSSPVDSGDFIVPLVLLMGFPVAMVLLLRRYVVSAYPSNETLHCDGMKLTTSKVRWLDIHNKDWKTRSYALAGIVNMRYQVIARSRGVSIYGLRFMAEGRTHRVLPGLKPLEAEKILKALKAFGADVPDDLSGYSQTC